MRILTMLIWIFGYAQVSGQDLSNLKSGNTFDVNGTASLSISYNGVNSSSDSMVNNADSYSIGLRGSLSFLGIVMPMQLNYRKGQFNASTANPFFRLGLSPTYKWAKVHLGYRTMQFSKYSLSDITFFGVGVEINPGNLRMAAMYGELKTPNFNLDTLAFHADLISNYKRKAHGYKLGFGKQRNYFDLFYFKAKDRYDVADAEEFYITLLPPPENMVIGFDTRFVLFKKLTAALNINLSAVTNNQNASDESIVEDLDEGLRKALNSLITVNSTTRANTAGEASLHWHDKFFNLGIMYKRIDPNYASFGIHYVLDDLENYTINGGVRLLKNRVSINGNVGVQRNNLKNIRNNTTERIIYNINSNIILKSNAGINLTYSNFAVDQRAGFVMLNDTFRFVQNTSVISVTPFYNWGGEKTKHSIQVNLNRSLVQDISPLNDIQSNGKTSAQVVNYRREMKSSDWSLGLGLLRNESNFKGIISERTGGNVVVGKRFNDQGIQLSLQTGYSVLSLNNEKDGYALNSVLSASWKINKRASLNALMGYLKKASTISRQYDEIRFSINLAYNLIDTKGNGKEK